MTWNLDEPTTWRRHFCLPRRDSSRRFSDSLPSTGNGKRTRPFELDSNRCENVEKSLDAAGTSARATSLLRRGLLPYGCVERLAAGNSLFQVLGKISIQSRPGIARFRQGNAFIDGTARAFHWLDDRNGPMILLDYDFGPLTNLLQHGLNVSNQLSLRHVEVRHTFDHTSSSTSSSSPAVSAVTAGTGTTNVNCPGSARPL
jgi:hypothetical protein